MEKNTTLSALLPIFGVIVGALLTFFTQFALSVSQQKSDIRKTAIELKNNQCIVLWREFADTYQYLFYVGNYAIDKIDMQGLGRHIKQLNVYIVRAEPFISHGGFLVLMKVRDKLNSHYLVWEQKSFPSYAEYTAFINELEEPMNAARDIMRLEMGIVDLGVVRN